jgi:hypothetical protein
MVVKDVYTGGVRTFLDTKDAHLFRKMLYAQVGRDVLQLARHRQCILDFDL